MSIDSTSSVSHAKPQGIPVSLTLDKTLARSILEAIGDNTHITTPADPEWDGSATADKHHYVSKNLGSLNEAQLLDLGLSIKQIELLPQLPLNLYDGKDRGLFVFEKPGLRAIVSEEQPEVTVTGMAEGVNWTVQHTGATARRSINGARSK